MSLYSARKAVPFQHQPDSDDDIDFSLGTIKKRKVPEGNSKKPTSSKTPATIIDLDDDDMDDDGHEAENRILKEIESKRKTKPTVETKVVNEDQVEVLDPVIVKAQKLLENSKSTKIKKPIVENIIELDNEPPKKTSYVLPKIASATERKGAKNVDDDAMEYLRNLTQDSSSGSGKSFTHAKESSNVVTVDDSLKLKLVTRLNGSHEWKWKIPSNDNFEKMKKKFSEIYGVNLEQFKFIFDGSVLKDNETPEAVDMEDSNIIDVKMDKSLYPIAVANASKYGK